MPFCPFAPCCVMCAALRLLCSALCAALRCGSALSFSRRRFCFGSAHVLLHTFCSLLRCGMLMHAHCLLAGVVTVPAIWSDAAKQFMREGVVLTVSGWEA